VYPSSQSTREHFHYPPKKPHITPTALGPASLVCHLSIDLPVRSLHINGSIHCLVFCDQLLSLNMFSRFIHVVACIRTSSPQAGIKIAGRNINNPRYAEEELKSLLMKVKEESEKAGLKLSIQKTKIMASSPITSWQIDGEKVEALTNFIFLCSKITADSDCSPQIKRHFLLGRKAMTNLDSVLKSRDITLPTNICIVKAMIFPVIMCGCRIWIIKKAECQIIDAFKLWCWRKFSIVPWTARRSNQSILKEINPEYSLEGLMLKLELQYFGHLIWRAYSLKKTLMLGKIEGRRRRGWQRMRRLNGITDSLDMSLSKLQEMVKDREAWRSAVHGVTGLDVSDWTTTILHCRAGPHFVYLFIGCFYFWAITNNVVMSSYKFLCGHMFSFLLGVHLYVYPLRNCQTVLCHSALLPTTYEGSNSSASLPTPVTMFW